MLPRLNCLPLGGPSLLLPAPNSTSDKNFMFYCVENNRFLVPANVFAAVQRFTSWERGEEERKKKPVAKELVPEGACDSSVCKRRTIPCEVLYTFRRQQPSSSPPTTIDHASALFSCRKSPYFEPFSAAASPAPSTIWQQRNFVYSRSPAAFAQSLLACTAAVRRLHHASLQSYVIASLLLHFYLNVALRCPVPPAVPRPHKKQTRNKQSGTDQQPRCSRGSGATSPGTNLELLMLTLCDEGRSEQLGNTAAAEDDLGAPMNSKAIWGESGESGRRSSGRPTGRTHAWADQSILIPAVLEEFQNFSQAFTDSNGYIQS
ncbi:hypothetical protein L596_028694 [Steinernema carpocapsae]|uniref:Uncharacterized protein n=1 Tax=Steinernema carpocapsae TaxID=34508 RepID=A0A4U5LZ87_STECR|nr:hypothetical protein L596_028694 [Steinernema carpocapsae]